MTNQNKKYLGIDVGGSHISAGVVDIEGQKIVSPIHVESVDARESAFHILTQWSTFLDKLKKEIDPDSIAGMGIAMPGPFNYAEGYCKINGVSKYESLFGHDIQNHFSSFFPDASKRVHFANDAVCFALGEYYGGAARNSKRAILSTLGTGFGSAFLVDGVQQTCGENIPEDGFLYHCPFGDTIADDYFSTRWFVRRWREETGEYIDGVRSLALKARVNDPVANKLFREFSENLAGFMNPWLDNFRPDVFVLGGNIARASDIFLDTLRSKITIECDINTALLDENAPLVGSALYACGKDQEDSLNPDRRKTSQFLLPERVTFPQPDTYNIYPAHSLEEGTITAGLEALVDFISRHKQVVIDGYVGVFWEDIIRNLSHAYNKKSMRVAFSRIETAMHTPQYIDRLIAPYMGGDDPLFGKITDLELTEWFNQDDLAELQPEKDFDIHILIGNGAALAGWDAPLIYVDLPKNELQFRMRAGYANGLGGSLLSDNRQLYKRYYFVDWRVLDKHKCEILPHIDLMVDGQHTDTLPSMEGEVLRNALSEMAHTCFRPRPWFEPGAWGGSWLKQHIEGINKDVPNLAWSFELMVLENGLLFESDGYLLEVSFDMLMYNNYREILGGNADRFRYDFPIRFDFLDTFDGGNLSVQCHPTNEYIREQFGMPFTQDETYYILDSKENAEVYLGFREGIDPEEFRKALTESAEHTVPLAIDKYVNTFPANKHDLFLIPNGTIHASGRNSLVLEISSAPYIFTFKMYDWLRLDLDGKPRPLNITHGMNNLNFTRQGRQAEIELLSVPEIVEKNEQYTQERLPTHPEHFYDVHRYSFEEKISLNTDNKCHVWMMVEGSSVILRTGQGKEQRFHYAETFVIPAAAGTYTLINDGPERAMMVQSFIR